jgi:hypothetical protein
MYLMDGAEDILSGARDAARSRSAAPAV